MVDLYLMAQLQGGNTVNPINGAKDSEYEKALDKIAEEYAEEQTDALLSSSQLMTREQAKFHLKKELKEAVRLEEQQSLLQQAIRCILEDGKRYLNPDEWEVLANEISRASETLYSLSYQEEIPEKLFPFLGMTQKGMDAIDVISRAKYQEENYSFALALNALLTALNPEAVVYWLHLGICYQDSGFFEKAIKAYSICHLIDPQLIPAWIFCSECYSKTNSPEDAKIEYEEAKRMVGSSENKSLWEEHLNDLKRSIGALC